MAPMKELCFKALMDWFVSQNASRWFIHAQASQFDVKDYAPYVNEITGMVILNISANATRDFSTNSEGFSFKSRIKGKEVFLEVPYSAVFVAVDPDTGIPNLFPYFEDHGDMDIETPETEEVLGTPVLKDPTVVELPHSGIKVQLKVPTLAEVLDISQGKTKGAPTSEVVRDGDNKVIRVTFGKQDEASNDAKAILGPMTYLGKHSEEPKPEPTVTERVTQRHWRVIQGGKGKQEPTMPYIDEVYRAKRDKREREEQLAKVTMNAEIGVSKPEIRSDGSDGKSSHFPDLDVSKCAFVTKPIERPEWMSVVQGGK